MEPFLKSVGGKRWLSTRLASEIVALKPDLYAEVFLGGGAVALALPPSLPKWLSDTNGAFVNVWRVIKAAPEQLAAKLATLARVYPNTALGYAKVRDMLNVALSRMLPSLPPTADASIELAALVMHINVRCFNGLWRTNSSGGFNVPWAKYSKVALKTPEELTAVSRSLMASSIDVQDFRVALRGVFDWAQRSASKRAVVYADPPYDGTFDGYSATGFDVVDQQDLAAWLHFLSKSGVSVFSTNADTSLIRRLYHWAKIESISEYHSVGAKSNRRGQRNCLLIRG